MSLADEQRTEIGDLRSDIGNGYPQSQPSGSQQASMPTQPASMPTQEYSTLKPAPSAGMSLANIFIIIIGLIALAGLVTGSVALADDSDSGSNTNTISANFVTGQTITGTSTSQQTDGKYIVNLDYSITDSTSYIQFLNGVSGDGQADASRVVVLDSSKGISGLGTVRADQFYGQIGSSSDRKDGFFSILQASDLTTLDGGLSIKGSFISGEITGSNANVASGTNTLSLGGHNNSASGASSAVVGGNGNSVTGTDSVSIGGFSNSVSAGITGANTNVGGSNNNVNTGDKAGNFAGQSNNVSADFSVNAGGQNNIVSGTLSGNFAGQNNNVSGDNSVNVSGFSNSVSGDNSGIIAGNDNTISTGSDYSVTAGGVSNKAYAGMVFVAGGFNNSVSGTSSAVIGGYDNTVSGDNTGNVAGYNNTVSGQQSGNLAGNSNTVSGDYSGNVAGIINGVNGDYSGNLAGSNNGVSGQSSGNVAGYLNGVSGDYSGNVAGFSNGVSGDYSGNLAGSSNTVSGDYSGNLAGSSNTVSGDYSGNLAGSSNTVSGTTSGNLAGNGNTVDGAASGNVAGQDNTVSNTFSGNVAGSNNGVSGDRSVNLGGQNNEVLSNNTVTLGGIGLKTESGTSWQYATLCGTSNNPSFYPWDNVTSVPSGTSTGNAYRFAVGAGDPTGATPSSLGFAVDNFGNLYMGDTETSSGASIYNYDSASSSYVAKAFTIQHPTIENKWLRHGCLEGPEGGVYYRGKGEAPVIIRLPDYATHIASDFTVQVTPIGLPRMMSASEVTQEGTFRVHGEGRFHWTAIGERVALDPEPFKTDVSIHSMGPYSWSV